MPRDLGRAEIGGKDLASELLANGWAKLKEIKREPTEDDLKRREIEAEAKAAGKGVWNPHGQQVCIGLILAMDRTEYILQARTVHHTMPQDSQAFVNEWKGKSLDGDSSYLSLLFPAHIIGSHC